MYIAFIFAECTVIGKMGTKNVTVEIRGLG